MNPFERRYIDHDILSHRHRVRDFIVYENAGTSFSRQLWFVFAFKSQETLFMQIKKPTAFFSGYCSNKVIVSQVNLNICRLCCGIVRVSENSMFSEPPPCIGVQLLTNRSLWKEKKTTTPSLFFDGKLRREIPSTFWTTIYSIFGVAHSPEISSVVFYTLR